MNYFDGDRPTGNKQSDRTGDGIAGILAVVVFVLIMIALFAPH